ncbi:FKBP-type peptidyl-prolyl cis-trans isomerase [Kitasatospora acidiphila]|uniref:peptidylprolyl isomerase n=1 Tax=Kitasatospora acidiphila TaxID=2567942 RepID=A0A540WCV1_9ACTN|nr:FKBP-type peptidyl-prolyl cis-trans isomerase [Kitasatospora acidiphila]TQF06224.1 FKBP-type peptidyl-prolyl cis-trans isomerase [Kitasatospora acidiphila]
MAENPSDPTEADSASGPLADPVVSGPGTSTAGRESIVVPPAILAQQAGWSEPGTDVPGPAAPKSAEPQVFASTVRKQQTSEADYENVGSGGKLGVVLGVVLAVLLVGSGIGLYVVNSGSDSKSTAADSATSQPSQTPSKTPVPPVKTDAKVLPQVSGDFGKKADIALPSQHSDGSFVVKPLIQGDGAKVGKGDWVSATYTAKDWTTGKDIPGSYDQDQGKPQLFQAGLGNLIPALDSAVVGQKAGTRVLVVAPPAAGFGDQGNQKMGVGPKDDMVIVVDIQRANAPGARVSGDVTPPPADFAAVKVNGDGKADTITPPANPADPSDLKTSVLIQGKGPKVENGELAVVQYTGVTLKDGKEFDSSLDKKTAFSFVVGGGNVIQGWDKGVAGQNVGSRIELEIPAAQAYGANPPQGSNIPANASLVFVVDILDAGIGQPAQG